MNNLSWQFVTFAIATIAAVAAILPISDARTRRFLLIASAVVGIIGLCDLFWSYQSTSSVSSSGPLQSPPDVAMPEVQKPADKETPKPLEKQQMPGREQTQKSQNAIPEIQYSDYPPKCSGDNKARLEIINEISDSHFRDFEYGSFILTLLSCKAFVEAVAVTSKIGDAADRDGALTKVAIDAIRVKEFQAARTSVLKISSAANRDLLTSILIKEMNRPAGYVPDSTSYATDVVELSYGSLGGATYDFRTGKLIDEFEPCVRGRASC